MNPDTIRKYPVTIRKSRASKLLQRQHGKNGKKQGSQRGVNPGKPWKSKTWKKPAKPHQKWTAKQKETPDSYERKFAFHDENYPEDPDEIEFERMTIDGEIKRCAI